MEQPSKFWMKLVAAFDEKATKLPLAVAHLMLTQGNFGTPQSQGPLFCSGNVSCPYPAPAPASPRRPSKT